MDESLVSFLSLAFSLRHQWIGVKGLSSFTTALYAAVSILPRLGYMSLWSQIRSKSTAPALKNGGKQIASVALYLTAVPMAYVRPVASLALIAIVAVLWLLPPRSQIHPE